MCKQHPETTRRRLSCKKLGLAMMLKALPLVHFWSVLLLKEQMMTSVRKMLNMLVLSAQNRSISSEICLEKRSYWWSLPRKLPRNSCEIGRFFHEFVPKNPAKLDFFFRDLSDALGYIKVQAWLLVFFFKLRLIGYGLGLMIFRKMNPRTHHNYL